MIKKKIKHAGVQCSECKTRLFSMYRHDFIMCKCDNETFADGGFDYLRYGYKNTLPKIIKWDDKLDKKVYGKIK